MKKRCAKCGLQKCRSFYSACEWAKGWRRCAACLSTRKRKVKDPHPWKDNNEVFAGNGR